MRLRTVPAEAPASSSRLSLIIFGNGSSKFRISQTPRGAPSATATPVLVIFEGEFYGPQLPNPKLPEAIRKIYHPAWDNHNSMTKLIVFAIQSVKPLSDHP